jgi:hypothetical protein
MCGAEKAAQLIRGLDVQACGNRLPLILAWIGAYAGPEVAK